MLFPMRRTVQILKHLELDQANLDRILVDGSLDLELLGESSETRGASKRKRQVVRLHSIPESTDPKVDQLNEVPTIRRRCLAVLKSDNTGRTLGQGTTEKARRVATEMARRYRNRVRNES